MNNQFKQIKEQWFQTDFWTYKLNRYMNNQFEQKYEHLI